MSKAQDNERRASPTTARRPPQHGVVAALRGVWRDPVGLFGLAVVLLIVVAATFASQLAPYDPNIQDLSARLTPPIWQDGGTPTHILGTDQLGRDVLSRIIHGSRITLAIPLLTVSLSALVGISLGLLAGYRGGATDSIIMRVIDTQYSFPGVLLALTILTVVGSSVGALVVVLSLRIWMAFARMTRGLVLAAREEEYVDAAETIGASPARIMFRHIAPNLAAPLIAVAVLESAHVMLSEAALSFLGLGIQPPLVSWGLDVTSGREYVFAAPWLILLPGVAISISVLGINLLASWLRVATDPKESAKRFAASVQRRGSDPV